MEWQAPLPVWMDSSIDIDIDEIPSSDSMTALLMDMDDILMPCTPKMDHTMTYSTAQLSPFDNLLDIAPLTTNTLIDIEASPERTQRDATMPSFDPITHKKSTKCARRLDPFGRDQRRKSKQRGYETNYRKRQKGRRDTDQLEWVRLESQLREMLSKRTSVVTEGSSGTSESGTSPSIRERYLELLHEARALRESMALDNCLWAETRALAFWGGANSKTRDVREQINTLPSLRACHTLEFSW